MRFWLYEDKKLLNIQDLTMLMLILLNSVGIYNYEEDIKVGKVKR
jgi:hypothetical protein